LAEFLKNEPIGEDLFSGRAQEHVAETICDNIERLHVIGLEGEWGSGKSNLVKILQQKLSNKDKKYFFFIYDAWAHQMDFQRRAIIEEIVEFIDREDGLLVTKDKLNYVKIKALGTVVETETELQSSFTWASFFLVCSIILTPAAIQLSTTLKFEWINYVISLMPIGCILFAVFISMRKQRKDFFSMGHLEHIKNQLIGAYKQGNTKSTKREYTDTKRPSTVVFRQFFHDVDESIPEGETYFSWALHQAVMTARHNASLKNFLKNGLKNALDMWIGVMPVVMGFGTIALILSNYTPIFEILGKPFIPILNLIQLPEAVSASKTMLVGFTDMFVPSIIASKEISSELTRFVVATVSVTQLIYMSEVGALIVGTRIPVRVWELFVIFLERTIISIMLATLIARFVLHLV